MRETEPLKSEFDAQPPGGLRIRVPGHVRPFLSKHLTCQSLHCGNSHPQAASRACSNKRGDIGARQATETGSRALRLEPESSLFLRHFRLCSVARLKLRQRLYASAGKAGCLRQPSGRLARWPFVRCPAGSSAKNAYEIDIICRSVGHLASMEGTDDIPHCND